MSNTRTESPVDALMSLLKSSFAAESTQAFGHLVLYTSFGVVRGRTGLSLAQAFSEEGGNGVSDSNPLREVIEINDVTVEHYSNHLATASFDRLYVRLTDIHGFALMSLQGSV